MIQKIFTVINAAAPSITNYSSLNPLSPEVDKKILRPLNYWDVNRLLHDTGSKGTIQDSAEFRKFLEGVK